MEGKPTNGDHIHAKSVPDKTLLTCYRVPGPPIVSSSQTSGGSRILQRGVLV